ncbi:MAG: D-alanyl-D-alanine carboxypeptidase [Solirubrobacterales bacterium]|nr:D-alanyl-D-alanine carboxypeptidase [Solirubrobacterales bacterium]
MRAAIPTALLAAVGLAVAPAPATARPPPRLMATGAALIEESTGKQLYGLAANRELPIASTTKVMTALLTLEHVHRLSTVFTQNDYLAAAGDSQIGLMPGERMSVHDLLLALLLPSADDAAEDLAYNVGHRSVGYFVGMMNARARELGLKHTHYSNPIGFDAPPGNYSSASDLVKLASYVLQKSAFFRRVVALPRAVLFTGSHVRVVTNKNDLVGRVPWISGVKTGHTLDAGYVLVGSGTRNRMTLIGAVLGAPSRSSSEASTLALLDFGFANYALRTPVAAGAVLARVPVSGQTGKYATVVTANSVTSVFRRSARVHRRVDVPRALTGPLPRHSAVGTLVVFADNRRVASVPLLLAYALPAPPAVASALLPPGTLFWLVAASGLFIGATVFWRLRLRARRAEPER